MGDPASMMQIGALAGAGKGIKDYLTPDLPEPEPIIPPVEEIDVAGQKQYTKNKLKSRKGRRSTILSKMRFVRHGRNNVQRRG